MQYQINIGLEVPNVTSTPEDLAKRAEYALVLLRSRFAFVEYRLEQSATEQTLVASFQTAPKRVYAEALAISDILQQDCVAVYTPEQRVGALVGQRAAQWGGFNPDYFIKF